jgi:hypothetical protein
MCFVAGFTQEFAKLIKDLGAPKLGLSSVGGDAGASVANAVGWEASTAPLFCCWVGTSLCVARLFAVIMARWLCTVTCPQSPTHSR